MNNLIKIGGQEYPFHFGMRTLYDFSVSEGLEFYEIDLESYDSLMKIFSFANKAAVDRRGEGQRLSARELEDAIDEDPRAFGKIFNAFNSSKFKKALEKAAGEEEPAKKKSAKPAKTSG